MDSLNESTYKNYFSAIYTLEGIQKKGLGAFRVEKEQLIYHHLPLRILQYLLVMVQCPFRPSIQHKNQALTEKKVQIVNKMVETVNKTHEQLHQIDPNFLNAVDDNRKDKKEILFRFVRLHNAMSGVTRFWEQQLGSSLSFVQRFRFFCEKKIGLFPYIPGFKHSVKIPLVLPDLTQREISFTPMNEEIRNARFPCTLRQRNIFLIHAGLFRDREEYAKLCPPHSKEKKLYDFYRQPLPLRALHETVETLFLLESQNALSDPYLHAVRLEQLFSPLQENNSLDPKEILRYAEKLRRWMEPAMKTEQNFCDELMKKTAISLGRKTPLLSLTQAVAEENCLTAISNLFVPLLEWMEAFHSLFSDIPVSERKKVLFHEFFSLFIRKQRWSEKEQNLCTRWALQYFTCAKLHPDEIQETMATSPEGFVFL